MERFGKRALALALCSLVLPASSPAGESIFRQSGSSTSRAKINCPTDRVAPVIGSRDLGRKIEEFNSEMDRFYAALEEWGTLAMSGLLFAPPVMEGPNGRPDERVGTFAIDNGKDFKYWMDEAGKAEGSVRFSERIFNSFNAAGTVQFAPEQAALAAAFQQRQNIDNQLFLDRVQRNQIVQRASLEDFRNARGAAAEARQVRIESARVTLNRAEEARAESQTVRDIRRRNAAEKTRLEEAAIAELRKDPENKTLQAEAKNATEDANAARDNLKVAESDLTAKTTAEDGARKAHADAVAAPIVSPGLPDSAINIPETSPTFGEQGKDFKFTQEISPGYALTQASTATASLPNATPNNIDKLGNDALPATLAGKDEGAVFPARARLIDAAGNMTIARIFDFLGNPSAALRFEDKPVLMAVGTIAVNPGWRTRQDYDGAIDASAIYEWAPARRDTCVRMKEYGELFREDVRDVASYYVETGKWPHAVAGRGIDPCILVIPKRRRWRPRSHR